MQKSKCDVIKGPKPRAPVCERDLMLLLQMVASFGLNPQHLAFFTAAVRVKIWGIRGHVSVNTRNIQVTFYNKMHLS